jgi:hypothetical protein
MDGRRASGIRDRHKVTGKKLISSDTAGEIFKSSRKADFMALYPGPAVCGLPQEDGKLLMKMGSL